MNLNFILNGEDTSLTADSNESVYQVLKREGHLFERTLACLKGDCCRCLISLDGKLVLSCRMPFFQIRGREVVTLEGQRMTQGFQSLLGHYKSQGIPICQECTGTQIFQILVLLDNLKKPTLSTLLDAIEDIPCRCGSRPSLEKAVSIYYEEQRVAGNV